MQVQRFVDKLREVGEVDLERNVRPDELLVQGDGLASHNDGVRLVKKALARASDKGMRINDALVLFVPIECAPPAMHLFAACATRGTP